MKVGIVKCIKDVVMDVTNEVAFKEGKEYTVTRSYRGYVDAINEKNEVHGLGKRYTDEFFKEHFEVVSLKTY